MKSSAAEYFRSLSPVKAEARPDAYEKSLQSGKSGRCHCCPYGYHIDLDFVRYCQALNQGAKNASPTLVQLKKLKRQRRRQTKSMEAMLGITHPDDDKAWFKQPEVTSPAPAYDLYKKPTYPVSYQKAEPTLPLRDRKKIISPPTPPPRKQSLTHPALKSPPPPDIVNSLTYFSSRRSEEASEALQEAVHDFEEILQSSQDSRKRKSRSDQNANYPEIDLLYHTPSYSSPYSRGIPKTSVGRSNSLPRQWKYNPSAAFEELCVHSPITSLSVPLASPEQGDGYNGEMEVVKLLRLNSQYRQILSNSKHSYSSGMTIFHDSPYMSHQHYKDWNGVPNSYGWMVNGYASYHQSPLIGDAMAALNAAQGLSSTQTQDFDATSVTSAVSGVSTSTLQSIREQMATGLSRLKELEEEVKSIPTLQVKLDILKEEKRILLEHVRCIQRGENPPIVPPSIEKDIGDLSEDDLEGKLHSLKKYGHVRDRRTVRRNRSISPMRVNLEDFHSYRRARRGSLSEGSDTESVHSFRGGGGGHENYREKGQDGEEMRLFISEAGDHSMEWRYGRKNAVSLPSTPLGIKKGHRDAAVLCKVVTRDVGVSHIVPKARSIGTVTDPIEDIAKRELKAKPCLQCFRRNHKTFETKGVGTVSPRQDSGRLSMSSLSAESITSEDLSHENSKTALLQKLGKKSPIISRLSSPQLYPPPLTFDNSTNTEPIHLRDQRLNTKLLMDNLFTREELDKAIHEAKIQWETTYKKRSPSPLKELKKIVTIDRGIQTYLDILKTVPKPVMQSIGIMVKHSTRDTGVGYSSILEKFEKTPVPVKTRSIGCGSSSISEPVKMITSMKFRSVGVGDCKLSDTICSECIARQAKHFRSIGCGFDRITDNICTKCSNIRHRHIGVGDAKITDEICQKCKAKRTVNSGCQIEPSLRSVSVEADIPLPPVIKESKETSLATTPEVERRPFGSSGVRICDKCHEAITSVAKDIVNTSGSPSSSAAVPTSQSKIPRLVEYQIPEIKVPIKPEEKPPALHVSHYAELPPPLPRSHELSANSSFSFKSDMPHQKVDEKPSKSPYKEDNLSTSSSLVSSSLPSIGNSPQVQRAPYHRQDTYTKMGGFVNPAFEEQDSRHRQSAEKLYQASARKSSPEKPKRKHEKKISKSTKEKAKETESVIKAREEGKASSTSSSSPSTSDDESEEAASVIASSVATVETQATDKDEIAKPKMRKKSLPSREMKAALKVLNDSIGKPFRSSQQLSNAINIIQRDWFKVSGTTEADPHAVEDFMDSFETYSKGLLHRVVNLSDINGNTAMHYAVSHGNFDVVSILLDSKVCNVNQQNKAGYTAIMLVALAQIKNDTHKSVVNKLFESGDVNIKASQHGQTALMLAVSHGRLDMVRMLIASGADPNIQDDDGSTALMCAAEHGHLAIVRYLVAQPDTDLYLMDNDGSTALTIAVEAGHKDVGVLLYKQMNLSRGSSPYSSLRGGKRPRTPTMVRASMTPPPRSSAPASPGRSRKSSGRTSPSPVRRSSASLSNLNI